MKRDLNKAMMGGLLGILILLLSAIFIQSWNNSRALARTGASLALDIKQAHTAEKAIETIFGDNKKEEEVLRVYADWIALLVDEPEHKTASDALRAALKEWNSARLAGARGPSLSTLERRLALKTLLMTLEEESDLNLGAQAAIGQSKMMGHLLLFGNVLLFGTFAFICWFIVRIFSESARFKEIADTIHEVFWMTSPRGDRMLYVSPGYEKIWGRSCASLYASPGEWIAAIVPEDRDRVHKAFLNLACGYDVEYRILTPNGQRWIRDRAALIKNAYGTILRVSGIASDITSQKTAELEMKASEERFRVLVESSSDAFFLVSADGKFEDVNACACESLGYSREELIGRSMFDVEKKFDPKGLEGLLDRIRMGERVTTIGEHRRKDGTTFPIEASVAIAVRAGKPCLLALIRDITARKLLEQKAQQAEKLAAVGQLAAGVAHEINNPLGVILGFAQGMACQAKAGDPLELPIKSIEREALRCKNLVQSLLTFARTSQTERAGMDLNATIEQAMSLVRAQVKMGQVELKVALSSGLPQILGNKNQLQQVVMNLAKNALDAMPNGGALTIKTELIKSAPQSWVCLEVSDTGTGIPAPLQARLFEPFFTTKPVGQGTGLGLSLVAEIVKKHSGEIDVESAPGRTVFRAKFPAWRGREIQQQMSALQRDTAVAAPA